MTAVDLTPVLVAIVGGIFSIATVVVGTWVSVFLVSNMKDKQAALAVSNAVKNSLGKIQQAGQALAEGEITRLQPHLNVPEYLAPGVQYVLDHAGEEAARFNLTPEAIADKIVAQLGLKNIETNLALTSSATPMTTTRTADGEMTVTRPVVAGAMAPVAQRAVQTVVPDAVVPPVANVAQAPLKPEEPSSESGTSPKG